LAVDDDPRTWEQVTTLYISSPLCTTLSEAPTCHDAVACRTP